MASSREGDDEDSSGSDRDEALDEDMEALRRACMIAGRSPGELGAVEEDGDSSESEDDLDLLRSIQERFAVSSSAGNDSPIIKPLNLIQQTESDEEDDFEILRGIQKRFAQYEKNSMKVLYNEAYQEASQRGVSALSEQNTSETDLVGVSLQQDHNVLMLNEFSSDKVAQENREDTLVEFRQFEGRTSQFPKCAQSFVDALKRNRSCQRFIRTKLIEIEAKIERNKTLKDRVKCLVDFHIASGKKANQILSQKKDPHVKLISSPRVRIPSTSKANKKKPLNYGPPENTHVSKYKSVLSRFPVSLRRHPWSKAEKEKLLKGIKQQYQERVLLSTMEIASDFERTAGDSAVILNNNFDFSLEDIRSFLPMVKWDRLASMYLPGRSGPECESRWLNIEDPLINTSPWTVFEEKRLLHIVQQKGIYNWIDISVSLGTGRTPFQSLVHYQRSLNPCILKKDWTKDEDAQLRAAVEMYGAVDWQLIASCLEGRTGPQCSNRWRKCLIERKVGRWSVSEDKTLKVAVTLFGAKNWNKIAQFIPGRTQVQCRERWVNCLDPSLNLKAWTEEEDAKLTEAIAAHGYCWSKVASFVPPRTDNQCWRRWKVLFRHEVPLRQAVWKMQKAVLITNFVDRESERPLIGPGDFCYVAGVHSNGSDANNDRTRKKRMSKINKHGGSRKCKAKAEVFEDNATLANWLEVIRHNNISKKRKRESCNQHKELVLHACSEGDHEPSQPMECIAESNGICQSDAAATSDVDPPSMLSRKAYSRRSKDKAKTFVDELVTNGLKEPAVQKTILQKRRKQGNKILGNDSSQSAGDHNHLQNSGPRDASKFVSGLDEVCH